MYYCCHIKYYFNTWLGVRTNRHVSCINAPLVKEGFSCSQCFFLVVSMNLAGGCNSQTSHMAKKSHLQCCISRHLTSHFLCWLQVLDGP